MESENRLLVRLDAIGRALAATGDALALIGLGSVGAELDRLDVYSDLDFFVIARDGCKRRLFEDLSWISAACPIAYHFQNSYDGYKLLYTDGIFCEFAIFERGELDAIPFAEGRVVWKDVSIDDRIATPRQVGTTVPARSVEWLLGEALTNLYVGLGRYHRGEKLSAARFIQGYAVDRIVELTKHIDQEQTVHRDAYAPERRYEQRFPTTARRLATFMQGYERSPESAAAMLQFLEDHFDVNPAMAQAIRGLC